MQADYSVECGPGDEALEIPWAAPSGHPSYVDLKKHPERLDEIPEAATHQALRNFLAKVNARPALRTAKCDVWSTRDLDPEDDVFQAEEKCSSYVDVLFTEVAARASLERNEESAGELFRLLQLAPEIQAAAEICVRRCYVHDPPESAESSDGFYLTIYVSGYGDDQDSATQHWAIGMNLLQNAILQLAR
jgi:hypothetical protein